MRRGEEYDYYTGQEADNMTPSDVTIFRPPTVNAARKNELNFRRVMGYCEQAGCLKKGKPFCGDHQQILGTADESSNRP